MATDKDRRILRTLTARVREIAELHEMAEWRHAEETNAGWVGEETDGNASR